MQETAKKILLVEDDPDIVRGLGLRLRHAGYEVVSAEDAMFAMTLALRERPDLVIMDIGLPGGDGLIVMDRLGQHESTAHIPVVFLTAKVQPENMRKAMEGGAVGYMLKPYRADELLSMIESALGTAA